VCGNALTRPGGLAKGRGEGLRYRFDLKLNYIRPIV
jgi:hypothetical protein